MLVKDIFFYNCKGILTNSVSSIIPLKSQKLNFLYIYTLTYAHTFMLSQYFHFNIFLGNGFLHIGYNNCMSDVVCLIFLLITNMVFRAVF